MATTIAIRVHEHLPVRVELDDLIHAGVLGLFDAAKPVVKPVVIRCFPSGEYCGFVSLAVEAIRLTGASRVPAGEDSC